MSSRTRSWSPGASWGKFRFESSLYTWLNHICVNLCYERLRKRKKMLVSLEEDLEKLTQPHSGWFKRTKGRGGGKKGAFWPGSTRIIDSMGEKCRQILVLRDREGAKLHQPGEEV